METTIVRILDGFATWGTYQSFHLLTHTETAICNKFPLISSFYEIISLQQILLFSTPKQSLHTRSIVHSLEVVEKSRSHKILSRKSKFINSNFKKANSTMMFSSQRCEWNITAHTICDSIFLDPLHSIRNYCILKCFREQTRT